MKLSERMRRGLTVRPFIQDWANEVADLEEQAEAWRQLIDSYVNGDGTARDLECALENGPMTKAELSEMIDDYELAALAAEEETAASQPLG